jgi:hypothetical protein
MHTPVVVFTASLAPTAFLAFMVDFKWGGSYKVPLDNDLDAVARIILGGRKSTHICNFTFSSSIFG